MGWKTVYPDHRKLAIVGHFEGVARPEGRGAGNIVIIVTHSGWFWLIPFADGTTSVGVVLEAARFEGIAGGIDAQFDAAIAATPEPGVRTNPWPKCHCQTRLTITRAVSGAASPRILSASSPRPGERFPPPPSRISRSRSPVPTGTDSPSSETPRDSWTRSFRRGS